MLITDAFPRLVKVDKGKEIGIEIEVEGDNLIVPGVSAAVDKWWNGVHDGSLRGNSIEYVLRAPIRRKDVDTSLVALKKGFETCRTMIHDSDRAGVHVHVNCQSLTVDQVINFLLVYYIFEDVLVKYCGEEREGNLFCLRAQDAEGTLTQLRQAKRSGSLNGFAEDRFRYGSVNIPALGKFGTLEFRSLKTPQDILTINDWVDMLLAIKDESLDFKDSKEIVETFSKNGEHAYLKKVFGKKAALLECGNLPAMLRNGIRRIQDIAYTSTIKASAAKKKLVEEPIGWMTRIEWASAEASRLQAQERRYSTETNRAVRPERDPGFSRIWIYDNEWNEWQTARDNFFVPKPYPGAWIPYETELLQLTNPNIVNERQEWEFAEEDRVHELHERYQTEQSVINEGEEGAPADLMIDPGRMAVFDHREAQWTTVPTSFFERVNWEERPQVQPAEPQPVPRNRPRGAFERMAQEPANWRQFYDAAGIIHHPPAAGDNGPAIQHVEPAQPGIGQALDDILRRHRDGLIRGDNLPPARRPQEAVFVAGTDVMADVAGDDEDIEEALDQMEIERAIAEAEAEAMDEPDGW